MAPLFWSIATSDIALWIDAVILAAALIVGYAPLLKWFPVIGPYVRVAKLVAFLVFGILSAAVSHRLTDESAELARVKIDLAFSQLQLDTQKQAAETAAKLRAEAEAKAEQANQKVTDYEERLAKQPADHGCNLDSDDVRSLHDIAR
ncbi:hypothetical protein Nham_2365 [Nitrobacter hamburgensis X14]|uniref:Uncharacterized protein n=1 Tax=Nitrobacter hamburgensis (strain DSM 10229 / NCIMB 13809 / X14) TaxID=323097 RepID=Q1QKU0_NITHX|nr:hypothetical protein [Nitrobacter hamburgensis]ABE63157.1 hypothetical protein Nham_2365 [Nitrobacter hamburgensis X14]